MEYSVSVKTTLAIYKFKETPECREKCGEKLDKCNPTTNPECFELVYTNAK